MPLIYDAAPVPLSSDEIPLSGTLAPWAGTQGTYDANYVLDLFEYSNLDWSGAGFNYGAIVVMTAASEDPLLQTMQSGSFLGNANDWGANGAPLENHDKTQVVSDDAPNIEEGLNTGEYNPFPYPPIVPADLPTARDATRFVKSYSFSRHQPVRIRIYKR